MSKYECAECAEIFINNFLLRKHVEQHNSRNKHECRVCKKLFANAAQLNTHCKSHVKKTVTKSLSKKLARESPRKQKLATPLVSFNVNSSSKSCREVMSEKKSKMPETPMRLTPSCKGKNWLRANTGIPAVGKMRKAFHELQKQIIEDAAAEAEAKEKI